MTSSSLSNAMTERPAAVWSEWLGRPWAVFLTFCVIGLIVYARILGTFFVADDFAYLDAIDRTGSLSVLFQPLEGRYFRPIVMLVYYLNYRIAGLSPWSFHIS